MKKILTIALVIGGVFVNAMTIKPVGGTDMGNAMVIDGLHVSLPSDMKNFPVELVPQS